MNFIAIPEKITPNAKLVYGSILKLCGTTQKTKVKIKDLASTHNVTLSTIRQWLNQLQRAGYISSDIIFDKVKREGHRIINIVDAEGKNSNEKQ